MASQRAANTWKIAAAIILAVSALVFGYSQFRNARPSQDSMMAQLESRENLPEHQMKPIGFNAGKNGGQFRLLNDEEREKMRAEFIADLNLTPEQQARLDELITDHDEEQRGPENWQRFYRSLREVLTDEQKIKMEEFINARTKNFRQRILERASILPPDQKKKFEEKLDKRIQERMNRRQAGNPVDSPAGDNNSGVNK